MCFPLLSLIIPEWRRIPQICSMLYLGGIFITLFLATLLLAKRNKNAGDRILATWLLVIAGHLALYYLFITGEILELHWLLGIHFPYPLLHGPFLFLYTAALTNHLPKKRAVRFLHFLPFFLAYIPLYSFFVSTPAEKLAIFRNRGAGYETYMNIMLWAIIASGILYVTASLLLLRKYRYALNNQFSNTEKINLAWLRYLVIGVAVIWLFVILGNDHMIFGIAVFYVFLLGFFGIRQVGVFSGTGAPADSRIKKIGVNNADDFMGSDQPVDNTPEEESSSRIKYEKSGLSTPDAETIHGKLKNIIGEEKIFTDPDLTLAALAARIGVHPNHLSQVINSREGKNFYDFINYHRVEEFKRIAPLPKNAEYTLLSLAFEAGFNSKTSFNRNFKKVTGISPTDYLQQQNILLK